MGEKEKNWREKEKKELKQNREKRTIKKEYIIVCGGGVERENDRDKSRKREKKEGKKEPKQNWKIERKKERQSESIVSVC